MKKGLCLLLSASMMLSMVGCGQEPKTVQPVVKADKVVVDENKTEVVKEEVKLVVLNKDIIQYSKEDKIIKLLEDKIIKLLEEKGYDMSKGYALYPNEEYFCPEYLESEDGLITVYLTQETFWNIKEFSDDEELLYKNFGSVKADSYQGAPSIGMIFNTVDSIMPSWSVNTEAGIVSDMSSIEEGLYKPFNTSEYKEVDESNYLNVSSSPLSTFAADVDTASYSNYRNILRNYLRGTRYMMDDLHDIRVEEMLNYFDYSFYNDKEYTNDKFIISAEIGDTPWNEESKLMVVNVKAKDLEENNGSNLVFLIDTSGSMNSPEKIDLLVESMKLLVNQLTEKDTVSIVTYASNDRVVLEGVKGSEKGKIIGALEELVARGSTNGEGGIEKAYKIAQKYMDGYDNNRIIMCSDGDLNVGISSEDALIDLVEKKRETGIYLSVLGFGSGNYKDNKMEALADYGNGNYYYIDSLKEGYKVLVEDLTSTLVTIADDVKFQLEFNPEYIKGYRKIGYENRDMANEDFHDDTKDGGEVGYGHEVTVVYELIMNDSNMELGNTDLKYQQTTSTGSSDWLTVSIRYKDHGEKESQLIEYVVDKDNYLEKNTDDWSFISDIIGFSLIANGSEYSNNLEISSIIENLKELTLEDEDKQEFFGLTIAYDKYMKEIETEKEAEEPYEPNPFVDLAENYSTN